MNMQQKLERSDEEFIQTALDPVKCEAQIQALSRERTGVLKYYLFFTGLFLLMLLIDTAAAFNSKQPSSDALKIVFVFQTCSAWAAYISKDVRIKFLKVSLAKGTPAATTN